MSAAATEPEPTPTNRTAHRVRPLPAAPPVIRRGLELWLAGAFALVHLVAPVLIGERYPFTISPMFCDQPAECCTYAVADANGKQIDPEIFHLHLVYDGNPPGLGMGIQHTPTLHPYCFPCQRQQVTDHVKAIMQREGIAGPVTITRRHLFPRDHKIIDETDQWKVSIDAAEKNGAAGNKSAPLNQNASPNQIANPNKDVGNTAGASPP